MLAHIQHKKDRVHSVYVFNNETDYHRINNLYLTAREAIKDMNELATPGTYLYHTYHDKYKYCISIDEVNKHEPIQSVLKKYMEKVK